MKSLIQYIKESSVKHYGDDTGANLFLLTDSYKGYKIYNLFDLEYQKDNLTDILQKTGVQNEMFRVDYDLELNSYSFNSLASQMEIEKKKLPSVLIAGLGSDCEIMRLKCSKFDDDIIMVMVLKKEKVIFVLPQIDIQGGEPRTWVYSKLFKDDDMELENAFGTETVYDMKEIFSKYSSKLYNSTNIPVYITMDEWYDNHAG